MTAEILKLRSLPLSAATLVASIMLAAPAEAQSSSERVLRDLQRPSAQKLVPNMVPKSLGNSERKQNSGNVRTKQIEPEALQQRLGTRNPQGRRLQSDSPDRRPNIDVLRQREPINRETAEEARERQKREECYKSRDIRGLERWMITFRGIEMSATGSDVDEIYGKIQFAASGTGLTTIWSSDKNVNIGKNPVKQFRRPAVKYIKQDNKSTNYARVLVFINVFDEDDGRDANAYRGNDDVFYVSGPTPKVNEHYIRIPIPTCNQNPDFVSRTERKVIVLHSNGNNYIRFRYELKWSRFYD